MRKLALLAMVCAAVVLAVAIAGPAVYAGGSKGRGESSRISKSHDIEKKHGDDEHGKCPPGVRDRQYCNQDDDDDGHGHGHGHKRR